MVVGAADVAVVAAHAAVVVGAAFISSIISSLVYLIYWRFIEKKKAKFPRSVKKQVTFDLDKNTAIEAAAKSASAESISAESSPPKTPPIEAAPSTPSIPPAIASRPFRPIPDEFSNILERARLSIRQWLADETPRTVALKEDGLRVYSMPDKGRPDRYRAHMLVKGPMQIAFQALYDVSSRADWDLGCSSRLVCWFDPCTSVSLYTNPPVSGVSSREFLDLRRLFKIDRGFAIVSHSVEMRDVPTTEGNVRAMNYATLQMVQQRDDDTAEVCYLVQSDLRGWLPASAIKLAMASSIGKLLKDLRNFVETKGKEVEPIPDLLLELNSAQIDYKPHEFN